MDLLIDAHTTLSGEPPEACLRARASVAARARVIPKVAPHHHGLPLRVGTRASPLALVQTRAFLTLLSQFCPVLRGMDVFQEHAIRTTGRRDAEHRAAPGRHRRQGPVQQGDS